MLTRSGVEVLSDCIKSLFPKETWHPGISGEKKKLFWTLQAQLHFLLNSSPRYLCAVFLQYFQCHGLNFSAPQVASGFVVFEHKLSIYITVPYYDPVCSSPSEGRPPLLKRAFGVTGFSSNDLWHFTASHWSMKQYYQACTTYEPHLLMTVAQKCWCSTCVMPSSSFSMR